MVQASVNHKKVAEGYSKAFKKIGDSLAYLSDSRKSLDIPRVQKALANAYVEVFKFLCRALQWLESRWKRLGSSILTTFYDDHIKSFEEGIEQLSKEVDREINRQTHDRVLDLQIALDSTELKKGTAARFRIQDDAEVGQGFENASKAFTHLGHDIIRCLNATEEQHDYGKQFRARIWALSQHNMGKCVHEIILKLTTNLHRVTHGDCCKKPAFPAKEPSRGIGCWHDVH